MAQRPYKREMQEMSFPEKILDPYFFNPGDATAPKLILLLA